MKTKEIWMLILLVLLTNVVFGQADSSRLILKISELSSDNNILLFQLANKSNTSFFAPFFNTSGNIVEIYSPKGDKISFEFIVCGRGLQEEIKSGQTKVWNYNIVNDVFEDPYWREKLEEGVYRIRWLVGTESQEYSVFYERN